ncbi:MAG: SDR family oxidoreductase, partial [Parvularculaceae bacterium]|nr:SDR family oxidoreductase [Parvularculaceae bacterium]
MDLSLRDRVAIVTGATSNIGRAIALGLAEEGAKIVAVGRDEDAGRRLVDAARAKGAGDAVFVAADLLDPASPARVMGEAARLGPPAILVNGVGGNAAQGLFASSDPADWRADIDLNFVSLLSMTRAVLPAMIAEKRGAVVNIGSTAGLVGDYMLPVYSAMKGAVHAFTIALAKETGAAGIRVNAVAPYATIARDPAAFSAGSRFHPETGFFVKNAGALTEADRAMRQRRTVLGRPFATPEEVAAVACFLASDRASYVTGQVWPVEGGALLGVSLAVAEAAALRTRRARGGAAAAAS